MFGCRLVRGGWGEEVTVSRVYASMIQSPPLARPALHHRKNPRPPASRPQPAAHLQRKVLLELLAVDVEVTLLDLGLVMQRMDGSYIKSCASPPPTDSTASRVPVEGPASVQAAQHQPCGQHPARTRPRLDRHSYYAAAQSAAVHIVSGSSPSDVTHLVGVVGRLPGADPGLKRRLGGRLVGLLHG
jgi:hypothetical protein